ncbi:MAG: hypothetical protein AB1744_04625 [Candidatus Zixiibacteriota bacterium]
MSLKTILLLVLGLLLSVAASAQTTLNPDVSLVGDLRAFTHDDESRAEEKEEFNLVSPEMELNVNGYLNPYARADAVVAWHGDHNAEIEELYATILRGLPLDMNLRAGKYLLEFGRLNPVHEHAWSFLKRPLPHEAFFGHEGLNDMAVRASVYVPAGEALTEVMVAVLKGDALRGHHDEEEAEAERVDPGFFARLTSSFAVTDDAELAVGASVVNGVYEVHEDSAEATTQQLRAWVGGVDIKYKYKPDRYTTLQLEAEGLLRSQKTEGDGDDLRSYGGYGYIDYRFRQRYNIGGILEYTNIEKLFSPAEPGKVNSETWRYGLFAGFSPVEETSLLRLAGHWTEPEEADGFWEVTLQLVFSLGPHQPHYF